MSQFNEVIEILCDKINQLKNLYLNGDAKTEEYGNYLILICKFNF